jgi:hypothetical protein
MSVQIIESIMEKLPITVNGREKFATGLNKQTTIDDIKFAMLSVTQPEFKLHMLDEYALVEKWQGNERMLGGRIKIYKLLRLWQSVPGNQLDNVQFYIKKIAHAPHREVAKLTVRDENVPQQQVAKANASKFAFCTLSPENTKTWNLEKTKRSQVKTSYVKRQLQLIADNQESSDDVTNMNNAESYASIKRINRSKKSTIKKTANTNENALREEFIDLVTKQNEIIDKQLSKLSLSSKTPSKKSTLSSKLTQSIIKTSKKLINSIDINSKQTEEVSEMNNVLCKMDDMITLKTKFIESLEKELQVLDEMHDEEDEDMLADSDTQFLIATKKQNSTSTLLSKLSSKSSLLSSLSIGLAQYGNKSAYSECDSDTGISSACSDDSHHLETLV